jgi:hypothetical protein
MPTAARRVVRLDQVAQVVDRHRIEPDQPA